MYCSVQRRYDEEICGGEIREIRLILYNVMFLFRLVLFCFGVDYSVHGPPKVGSVVNSLV